MQVFRVTDVVAANDVLKFFIFKNILCAWRRSFPGQNWMCGNKNWCFPIWTKFMDFLSFWRSIKLQFHFSYLILLLETGNSGDDASELLNRIALSALISPGHAHDWTKGDFNTWKETKHDQLIHLYVKIRYLSILCTKIWCYIPLESVVWIVFSS